jgi:hypothetical protein
MARQSTSNRGEIEGRMRRRFPIIGAALAGYHAGKKLDQRVIEIRIVAEDWR